MPTQGLPGVSHLTPDHVATWYQARDRGIYLGDVLDTSNSDTMSAGFAVYAPGQSNNWVVTYDEVLIVTRGEFTVTPETGQPATAGPGELIFLRNGTKLIYAAGEQGAEVVYVAYPAWMPAQEASEHADLLTSFQPIEGRPPVTDNAALLRRIWDPVERGESYDVQPFFDALADDVVFTLSVGELRGKKSVIAYFANAAETIEFNPRREECTICTAVAPEAVFTVRTHATTRPSTGAEGLRCGPG
ncbi:MAG: cupin domain-containing protein [Micromonosporaceae bacterium]